MSSSGSQGEIRVSDFFRSYVNQIDRDSPRFRITIISDFPSIDSVTEGRAFMDWNDRQFSVRGKNAGYHLFQSVLHGMMVFWEKEWATCLDELDNSVRVKIEDILSHERSESLMFDGSFQRSRVYFKVLQLLRIFSDNFRETGRNLSSLARNDRGSWSLPGGGPTEAEAETLRENWKLIMSFQAEAEKRLLQRIAEKSEEIKSLRDGLFNATSLLEASRSTTMNRYIIVFTIVTVIYLPPNFVATVFGTDLFNADDVAGTVRKFKVTTVVVSITTYTIAFILVWLADKMGLVRWVYRRAVFLFSKLYARQESPKSAIGEDDTVKGEGVV